jgi:hypothetical protein
MGEKLEVAQSYNDVKKLHGRNKRGENEKFKGAFGEAVFMNKYAGDETPERRAVINEWRKMKAQEEIDRVKKLHGDRQVT